MYNYSNTTQNSNLFIISNMNECKINLKPQDIYTRWNGTVVADDASAAPLPSPHYRPHHLSPPCAYLNRFFASSFGWCLSIASLRSLVSKALSETITNQSLVEGVQLWKHYFFLKCCVNNRWPSKLSFKYLTCLYKTQSTVKF